MESLYSAFAKDIEVIYREDHTPTFNGWDTVYCALLDNNELFKELSFVDRVAISAAVMNIVCPLGAEEQPVARPKRGSFAPGKSYIYTYDWDHINDDYTCMVFDAATGNVVFDEWFKVLKQHSVMADVEDVKGLMNFLVHQGELLHGDKISFQFKGRSEPKDNDDSLET